MDGYMAEYLEGGGNGWIERQMNRWVVVCMDGWRHGGRDRRMDRWMDE